MAAEAQSRKEFLLKHGLGEEVLTGLEAALDQFESAVERVPRVGWSTWVPLPSWIGWPRR